MSQANIDHDIELEDVYREGLHTGHKDGQLRERKRIVEGLHHVARRIRCLNGEGAAEEVEDFIKSVRSGPVLLPWAS